MAYSSQHGYGCPWKLLGVDRSASREKVREAYRKKALEYHPDRNKGCHISKRRFQLIKEAYEEIQTRRETANLQGPFSHRWDEGENTNARYRYSGARAQSKDDARFYGFRRDRRAYPEDRSSSVGGSKQGRPSQSVNYEAMRAMRMRFRHVERAGIGLGVLLAATTVCSGMVIMDYAWRVRNRGKSFEEMMKGLDANADEKRSINRKAGRPPPPGYRP